MKVYDADQISLILGAVNIDSGFDDGEFVRIEQEAPDFTHKVGTDGEVTRSKTNNKTAKITVILMQSSDSNALLSAINNVDKLGQNGAGVFPLLIKDRQGTSIYAASQAWISEPPKVSFGREASAREWVIMCADLERLDGGN